jgi:hypothetical protein
MDDVRPHANEDTGAIELSALRRTTSLVPVARALCPPCSLRVQPAQDVGWLTSCDASGCHCFEWQGQNAFLTDSVGRLGAGTARPASRCVFDPDAYCQPDRFEPQCALASGLLLRVARSEDAAAEQFACEV